MVKPEVIRKRLQKLDEYLTILADLRSVDLDKFIKQAQLYGSAERFLHLAIETSLDIGNHIIADENLGIVNQYRDIPTILKNKGYIDTQLTEIWFGMIGFRNILVHDYLDVDRTIVYDMLQKGLDDFKELRRVFAGFL